MLTKNDILHLLSDEQNQENLFQKANIVRKNNVGDDVHLRGLIEFSNFCRNDCLYCGIRKSNRTVHRFRLSENDIVSIARKASDIGFKTIVMQSGEDVYFTKDRLCRIIEAVKKNNVAVTLSVGERTYDEYKAFRQAGADRYLLRIETTDKNLYHKLDPKMSWDKRYECLLALKELGFELGSGIMVGLPEQTIDSIAEDLLFLKNLEIDMAGIGPFIPHPQTPLKNAVGGTLDLSLRTMAVMRLLMPDINIPATTAMESLHPNGRIKALQSGANVIMPNISEMDNRLFYELYPGKVGADGNISENKLSLTEKIKSIGRNIGTGFGNRQK